MKLFLNRQGITLMEVAVTVVIGGILSLAAMTFLTRIQRAKSTSEARAELHAQSKLWLREIRKHYRQRLNPGAGDPLAVEWVNSPAFSPTGAGNCQDLKIRRRDMSKNPPGIHTLWYRTVCGPTPNRPPAHPEAPCQGNNTLATLSVYQWPNETTALSVSAVPPTNVVSSSALCLRRVAAGGAIIELGMLPPVGSGDMPSVARALIPAEDRPLNIEYLPPQ